MMSRGAVRLRVGVYEHLIAEELRSPARRLGSEGMLRQLVGKAPAVDLAKPWRPPTISGEVDC
jgi:hypothetical protein